MFDDYCNTFNYSTDWKYYNAPVLISHCRQPFHKNSYLNQGLIYLQFMTQLQTSCYKTELKSFVLETSGFQTKS